MRAILSVYDKTGLVEFARGLVELGFELVASGGTARTLAGAGLPVTPVERCTGFPELLGRPRQDAASGSPRRASWRGACPSISQELPAQGIAPVDLVVCNLYPFAATIARAGRD